ncbi:ribonuclease H-like domain-containing protein [Paramaledivibacter caminithermalis]|jgi:uncharacterized protein YprB with RNaseH-like and TPR domain|uniref:YprB ribonuclease H-like domain-containing protein n=1 Tax=Paramaledivibacter caminithermalis (strain DSM 15212 / CIP 107654 / DViRD3) TaxID=1121301 RepID=A0A1M6U2M8_PARC5|nr:ribonuclease H-like domain-containing protein [Paramaledivibacter caminithermalis]SHK63457.1 hypothetical protein SAMN02745912_03859 [Paramaledivibacter caminithermalis DSM 15212]
MDIIINTLKNSYNTPPILSQFLNNKNFILFDIETTGLNANYNRVILIGVLYKQADNIVIKQFFCNDSSEEKQLLESFMDTFKTFDFYITYNGRNFDIPFLNKRFTKHRLNYKIDNYLNFDLYKVVKSNKNFLGLDNCKLKTLEKFLGINRKDMIDGAESVKLYKKYEYTKDTNLKSKILLHNYEDILHLLPTLDVLNYISKDNLYAHFPKEFYLDDKFKIRIIDYRVKKDFLEVWGKFYGNINQDLIFYNHNYNFSLMKGDKQFNLRLPLLNVNNGDEYSFINLYELDFMVHDLNEMSNKEKLQYLVKAKNEIKNYNIYKFIKDFSIHILKQFHMNKDVVDGS